MKRSSEVLLVAVLLAASFVLPSIQADDANPASDRHAALAARLGLSRDQQASLERLRAEARRDLAALRANSALEATARHTAARSIRQDYAGQCRALLTADQQARLDALRRARRAAPSHQAVRRTS